MNPSGKQKLNANATAAKTVKQKPITMRSVPTSSHPMKAVMYVDHHNIQAGMNSDMFDSDVERTHSCICATASKKARRAYSEALKFIPINPR